MITEGYDGDVILIEKLIEFLPEEHWEWDDEGKIDLEDISVAIHEGIQEILDPYGDTCKHPVLEKRTREWHIGRILCFIKHPNEICDIEIDNECNNGYILPQSVIVDGWHRYAATRWLFDQGKLFKIHCRYGGMLDVLDYLKGNLSEYLEDIL